MKNLVPLLLNCCPVGLLDCLKAVTELRWITCAGFPLCAYCPRSDESRLFMCVLFSQAAAGKQMFAKVKFHRTLPQADVRKGQYHWTLPQADVRKGQISQGITPN